MVLTASAFVTNFRQAFYSMVKFCFQIFFPGTMSERIKVKIKLNDIAPSPTPGLYFPENRSPVEQVITGETNLIQHNGLESAYHRYCNKKVKEELSAFLPNVCGNVDVPGTDKGQGTLQGLFERPPICNKEILPLSQSQLIGFRLHPGPVPSQIAQLFTIPNDSRKRERKRRRDYPNRDGSCSDSTDASVKLKKQKRSEEDKERRKKKKEKKRKKEKE